jgi:hypothetical protein
VAVNGLAMFQPVIRSAKLFKCFAVVTGSVGLASLWTRKKVYISGTTQLGDVFGEKDLHYAFFTGTDSPHRKVAVQVIGRDGTIKGFAKVSCNSAVKPLLAHEADTLNHVNTLDLQTALIPKVLFNGEMGGAGVLITDTLKTCRAKTVTTLTDAHVAFLHELADKTTVPGTVVTDWVVTELRHQFEAIVDRLPVEWQGRLEKAIGCLERYEGEWGTKSFCHGDFTPWNTFFVDGRLYVFDWEYAKENLPVHDLVHYTLSLPRAKRKSINEIILQVRNVLREVKTSLSDISSDMLFLSYLCGNSLHYIKREPVFSSKLMTWDGEIETAKLIDAIVLFL